MTAHGAALPISSSDGRHQQHSSCNRDGTENATGAKKRSRWSRALRRKLAPVRQELGIDESLLMDPTGSVPSRAARKLGRRYK